MYSDEVRDSIDRTNSLVTQLGDNNPILRDLLIGSIESMRNSIVRVSDGTVDPRTYQGRRLMQRKFEYEPYMNDVLVNHP
jgi:hypothetical protein